MLGKITGIEKKVKWSRGKTIQVYGPPIYGDHNIFVDLNFNVAVFIPKSYGIFINDINEACNRIIDVIEFLTLESNAILYITKPELKERIISGVKSFRQNINILR